MKKALSALLCGILVASPVLATAAPTLKSRVLQAGLKGGQAKACGVDPKPLMTALHKTLFHSQLDRVAAQQMKQAFTYAFNLGIKRQLKHGKSGCGHAPQLLAAAVKTLGAH